MYHKTIFHKLQHISCNTQMKSIPKKLEKINIKMLKASNRKVEAPSARHAYAHLVRLLRLRNNVNK